MNIDDLKIGDLKGIMRLLNPDNKENNIDSEFLGKYVIIRTYSAGVWAGFLYKKAKNEVILKDARRMWKWHAKESISLSGVALHGINEPNSKICGPIEKVWLEAIEILETTDLSQKSVQGAKIAAPQ